MKAARIPSVLLSIVLQALPLVRTAAAAEILAAGSPIVVLLRWIGGAAAVAGSMHGVSGSSIAVTSPADSRVRATNGVDVAFRVSLTYTSGSTVLSPVLYEAANLPPGFNQPTKSGSIWRITGRPAASGTFANVMLTGYQNANKSGNKATVPLTITVVDEAPAITTQPSDLTVTAGQAATLAVTATGGSLTFQWLKGDLEIPKATNASVTFPSAQVPDGGIYRVRIANSGGSILSSPALLTVIAGNPPPEFTTMPRPRTVHAGEALVLDASATGEGPLVWSWSKDGIPLADQTQPSLSIPVASASDGGTYVVTVTGSGGSASAPGVRLTVTSGLRLDPPVAWGAMLLFDLVAITNRVYSLEMASPESPPAWVPVAEGSVTASPESSIAVPLRFQVPRPDSESGLFRVRAR